MHKVEITLRILTVLVLGTGIAALTKQETYRFLTLRHVSNSSLCVRTESYYFDGAIMRLSDCDKEYQFYDGNKELLMLNTDSEVSVQVQTTWAPDPIGFGLNGCISPDVIENNLRAKTCDDNISEYWTLDALESPRTLWRNAATGFCAGVSEVRDGATLILASCNDTDTLQQWIVEYLSTV